MLRTILTIVQVFSCFTIILLVLIQRGKGADAGAGFGAGASGTVFGARGARTGLSRTTAIFAAVFMLNSLALAYTGTRKGAEPKTILDVVATAPAKPTSGAAIAPAPTAPLTATPLAPAPQPSK
ncbi:MAG TPA: preprotein translocase subunit SecG [Steroidobacteraceae bacterium]